MTAAAGAAAAASSVEFIFLLDLDFFFFFHFTLHHINSFSLFELARSCVRSLRLFLFSALSLFRSLSHLNPFCIACMYACDVCMAAILVFSWRQYVCTRACVFVCVYFTFVPHSIASFVRQCRFNVTHYMKAHFIWSQLFVKANVYFSFKTAILQQQQQQRQQQRHSSRIDNPNAWHLNSGTESAKEKENKKLYCCIAAASVVRFTLRYVSFRFGFVPSFVRSFVRPFIRSFVRSFVQSVRVIKSFFPYIIRIKSNIQNGRARYAIGSKFSNATTHTRRYVRKNK